jgi:hypothetical protein
MRFLRSTKSRGDTTTSIGQLRLRRVMARTAPSKPPSIEALFRYRVVSEMKVEQLRGSTRACAVDAVLKREHTMLDGCMRTVSRSTLYRWAVALRST